VPLRDIDPYHEWIKREAPSQAARSVARTFIAEIGDEPWRAPSIPIAELSNQPEYEMRTVVLPVAGENAVHVWYRHYYATGKVDVLNVTNR
jgi:hypothetical protein